MLREVFNWNRIRMVSGFNPNILEKARHGGPSWIRTTDLSFIRAAL